MAKAALQYADGGASGNEDEEEDDYEGNVYGENHALVPHFNEENHKLVPLGNEENHELVPQRWAHLRRY